MIRVIAALTLVVSVLLAACASNEATQASDSQPGLAKRRAVTDTYHGFFVSDEYRWLEDWNNPEVKAWSNAQNAKARAHLDALPGVHIIRERVTAIMSATTTRYSGLVARDGNVFAFKNEPPKQQGFIVVLDAATLDPATERVLVDPNTLDPTFATSIDWFRPSWDGKLLAVSISSGGSEAGDVHVFDVATGQRVHEVIPRVQGGTAGGDLAWDAQGHGFFYTRYPRAGERPAHEMDFFVQVYYHELGTPTEQDRYELGKDFPKIAEIVLRSERGGYLLASMQKGDGGEYEHYVLPAFGPDGGEPTWKQLTTYNDQVVQSAFGPGCIYMISHHDAPRGKLVKVELTPRGEFPAVDQAITVIPESDATILHEFFEASNMLATRERIYLTYQTGGPSEIRVFDHRGVRQVGPRQAPISAVGGITRLKDETILFHSVSYVQPLSWFTFTPGTSKVTKLNLGTTPPVSFDDCEVVREFATSKDGTKVPVNILRKKGIQLDGSNPCLVTGYGGYGVCLDPAFRPTLRVLLDHGFVWAEANLRGGGEFGKQWHLQGNLLNKQNVFDDFHAVCAHLVDQKYTSRQRLAIQGGSNGGLLMGAVVTQNPEIAKAVISSVGIYDMLRVELSANGEFNITEFGTVKDKSQFEALYAYSPYHHVKNAAAYPAILFLTGTNDPRVDPMQSRKMTARLQAATANVPAANLVLLRTSDSSGHGAGTALSEQIEQRVDQYAFLFNELGVEAKK
jgi:prolyl oligopeptidase